LLLIHSHISSSRASFALQFRPATTEDLSWIRSTLLREYMNPLSVQAESFLIATTNNSDNDTNPSVSSPGIGFGQIRPLNSDYAELASLYVAPKYRRQGVGSQLVQRLVQQHDKNHADAATGVCLLTLRPTAPFYQPFGFTIVTDKSKVQPPLPGALQLEIGLGNIVSTLLGNELICMVRPPVASTGSPSSSPKV
jgi:N-acetylglutamate synthase-like GNAT family acetyltransferase